MAKEKTLKKPIADVVETEAISETVETVEETVKVTFLKNASLLGVIYQEGETIEISREVYNLIINEGDKIVTIS